MFFSIVYFLTSGSLFSLFSAGIVLQSHLVDGGGLDLDLSDVYWVDLWFVWIVWFWYVRNGVFEFIHELSHFSGHQWRFLIVFATTDAPEQVCMPNADFHYTNFHLTVRLYLSASETQLIHITKNICANLHWIKKYVRIEILLLFWGQIKMKNTYDKNKKDFNYAKFWIFCSLKLDEYDNWEIITGPTSMNKDRDPDYLLLFIVY